MSRRRAHPPELRARVVAEILAGDSVAQAARRSGVPLTTAKDWWRTDRPVHPASARTREAMAELIYDAVSDLLGAVRHQLSQTGGDDGWLAQQTAADIGSLLGTEVDAAIRLLSGFRPSDDGPGARSGPSVDAGLLDSPGLGDGQRDDRPAD